MEYYELQETVFQYLYNKHKEDKDFTFSVRQAATQGAERNRFIGTSRSSYFSFTCWDIYVSYPGSSGDLAGFIFKLKDGTCSVRFEFGIPRAITGEQNLGDLALGRELLKRLQSADIDVSADNENFKQFFFQVPNNPKRFNNEDDLLKEWENLYSIVAPYMDAAIQAIKPEHPTWQAGRFSLPRFENLFNKMEQRIQRYANASQKEIDSLPEEKDVQLEIKPASSAANTILFGPPGTGKTYHTIDKALQVVDPVFYSANRNNRVALTQKFQSLLIKDWNKTKGQIAFVTFHQSLSYEDFVEGIKPSKPKPGEPLAYDIEDGIFKQLCKLARSNFESAKTESQLLPFEEAFEKFKEEWEENPDQKFPLKTQGYDYTVIGFTNTSIQFRKASGGTGHTLSVNTLKEQYYGKVYDFKQGVGIYYPPILSRLKSYSSNQGKKIESLNYVLIIDEINRGNVSQILGELITLVEEDKRIGNKEALEVMLPYSKEAFGVPANVYIIGTMNTADRSVEALDTALRRRFVFEEIQPAPELLNSYQRLKALWIKYQHTYADDQEWIDAEQQFMDLFGMQKIDEKGYENFKPSDTNLDEYLQKISPEDYVPFVSFNGVDLQMMLTTINNRLEALNTKDHAVGHAWLMDVYCLTDLQNAFKNKIFPLLQEYFYNNYAKIGLVLGDRFFEEQKKVEKKQFASFKYGNDMIDDYSEKIIYKLKDATTLSNEDFQSIYE